MDLATLTEITKIISSLGDKATDSFIMYLGYAAMVEVLTTSIQLTTLWVVYKIVKYIITCCKEYNETTIVMKNIRDALGVGEKGILMNYELPAIQQKIDELLRTIK